MDMCRVCLKSRANKNIFELEKDINGNSKDYIGIMAFCLDIKIRKHEKITSNLCLNCYRKIVTFHKFKELALKSDAYLRSLVSESFHDIKDEVDMSDDEIKAEDSIDNIDFESNLVEHEIKIKNEPFIKHELILDEVESDDELLSVIQKVKYENNHEETKENAPIKKNAGRSKKPKCLKADNNKKSKHQVCDECGKSVSNLKEHSVMHLPKSERKRIKCKVCDRLFSSYSARYRHNKIKHLGIKKKCDICLKEVVSLRQHRLVVHNSEALPFPCVPCGRRFISQSVLEIHMTSHTKDRPHECDLCEKKFRGKMNLLLHKRQVHEKEKSHLCQFCSKTFFKKYHLQVHLRSHTKERPYGCPKCGKFFSSTSTLKSHMLIHSEVKMFKCQICDMTFSRPGYLKNHQISHTKEKRYPCQYCGVKFGRSDHRKRHEWTAHQKHIVPSP